MALNTGIRNPATATAAFKHLGEQHIDDARSMLGALTASFRMLAEAAHGSATNGATLLEEIQSLKQDRSILMLLLTQLGHEAKGELLLQAAEAERSGLHDEAARLRQEARGGAPAAPAGPALTDRSTAAANGVVEQPPAPADPPPPPPAGSTREALPPVGSEPEKGDGEQGKKGGKKEGDNKTINVANQFLRYKNSIPKSVNDKLTAECKEGGSMHELAMKLVNSGDYKSLNGFILARKSAVASEQWLMKMTPVQRKPFVQEWDEELVTKKEKAGKKAVRMNDEQLLAKASDVRQSLSEWEHRRKVLLEKLGSSKALEQYLTLPTVDDAAAAEPAAPAAVPAEGERMEVEPPSDQLGEGNSGMDDEDTSVAAEEPAANAAEEAAPQEGAEAVEEAPAPASGQKRRMDTRDSDIDDIREGDGEEEEAENSRAAEESAWTDSVPASPTSSKRGDNGSDDEDAEARRKPKSYTIPKVNRRGPGAPELKRNDEGRRTRHRPS